MHPIDRTTESEPAAGSAKQRREAASASRSRAAKIKRYPYEDRRGTAIPSIEAIQPQRAWNPPRCTSARYEAEPKTLQGRAQARLRQLQPLGNPSPLPGSFRGRRCDQSGGRTSELRGDVGDRCDIA